MHVHRIIYNIHSLHLSIYLIAVTPKVNVCKFIMIKVTLRHFIWNIGRNFLAKILNRWSFVVVVQNKNTEAELQRHVYIGI